jgi:Arc/MetJ-type ribon-helix-helix transcriptional regulator
MEMVVSRVQELRQKLPDSEKITINLGFVDLGQIDLMVRDGFYANRTDFIRTSIRHQLDRHADAVRQSVARKTLDLGLCSYTSADLGSAAKCCTSMFWDWRQSLPM